MNKLKMILRIRFFRMIKKIFFSKFIISFLFAQFKYKHWYIIIILQIRWKETVEILKKDLGVLLGNVFLAGASIAYYGPFTGLFREDLVLKWMAKAVEYNIPCDENYTL